MDGNTMPQTPIKLFLRSSMENAIQNIHGTVIGKPTLGILWGETSKDLITEDDVSGAQDYYLCATISDPKDGEVMMQYATLVWELHRDIDKALTYQILNFEEKGLMLLIQQVGSPIFLSLMLHFLSDLGFSLVLTGSRAGTYNASLCLKVRWKKISERMKYLQDSVPGCNKITGKGDETKKPNYVSSTSDIDIIGRGLSM
ncbi:hypothetical protein Tco_0405356 [Tanacetum coccineum]